VRLVRRGQAAHVRASIVVARRDRPVGTPSQAAQQQKAGHASGLRARGGPSHIAAQSRVPAR